MNFLHVVRARGRLAVLPLGGLLGLSGAMLLGTTTASAASMTITSSPLSIIITTDLNCQAAHVGDPVFEFFPSTEPNTDDCGTYLWAPNLNGGKLLGPATGHARTFTPDVAWVPVSQTLLGTTITTVVDSGTQGDPNCGLRITQTDAYTPGQERYRTTVAIAARSTLQCTIPITAQRAAVAPHAPSSTNILYRAGDCFLQGSDKGFGVIPPTFGPTGSVYCRGVDGSGNPGPRLEGFEPVTAGSSFVEDHFGTVWNDINARVAFPNTCTPCGQFIDNGAGLSWNGAIDGTSFVSDTVFSPLALAPPPSPTPVTPTLPKAGDSTRADSSGPAALLAVGIVVALLLTGLIRMRNRAT